MNANIDIPKREIAAFCRCHRIRRMALFGSVLRDDFGPESDVDVLVAFEPGVRLGWEFFSVAEELGRILGRKADMHTIESIANKQNWLLREEILGSAESLYERGPGYESWPQEGRAAPLKTGGKRRDDRVPLLDMLIHARKAVHLFGEVSREDLEEDEIKELALTRVVEVIGEAANRVSQTTQERHPEVPWGQIIGARNLLAHGYDEVDLDKLCDIVRNHLPPLIRQLEAIVGKGA
jgi:uncharacterized protein with HEPN domain/predicted nucleotidyltransferase